MLPRFIPPPVTPKLMYHLMYPACLYLLYLYHNTVTPRAITLPRPQHNTTKETRLGTKIGEKRKQTFQVVCGPSGNGKGENQVEKIHYGERNKRRKRKENIHA